jgi:alpha-L-fucosidase
VIQRNIQRFLVPFAVCLLIVIFCSGSVLQAETPEQYQARTQWLREARFGMFIHWGVYAVPAGEWKGRYYTQGGEWILRLAGIPIADYKNLARQFTADKYDPKAWADLAKEAGMKYVVLTAKHHDGFALYDSKVSDWNAVKASGAARDLIAPLADAVRADGLKFCLYYSQSQDWTHPGGGNYGNAPKWDKAQEGDYDQYLQTIALPQVREILTLFHPSVIWWDTPVSMTPARAKPFADLLQQLQPDIISNSRLGGGFGGDTSNAEQHIPPRPQRNGRVLEVCMTMNDSWGFKTKDTDWKSTGQLLRVLSDCASKGGNLLLNIGPDAHGQIPTACVDRLKAMGAWLQTYSQAIYGTDAGIYDRPLPWGRTTRKTETNGATTLYLNIWDRPENGELLLPSFTQQPSSAVDLKTGEKVSWSQSKDGLIVTAPPKLADVEISILKLTFPAPLPIIPATPASPGTDGKIEISAMEAFPIGDYSGCLKLMNPGPDAYLTDWTNSNWLLNYEIKTPTAAKWTLSAEVASDADSQLSLSVKKATYPIAIPSTGGKTKWQTVDLCTIDLPAGTSELQFKPAKADSASSLSIRRVWLSPNK